MERTLMVTRQKGVSQSKELKITQEVNYKRQVLLLIISITCIRFIPAYYLELGNDETYYWHYAQYLRWNYFDHPPMVALWGRLFTLNLAVQNELFVRLGSLAACAFSTWFIFKTTSILHTPRAGWLAAVLFSASFYSGIVAGIFLMPDSPQMFFWTLSLWLAVQLIHQKEQWLNWILFAIAAGLCIMSKVHGVFIWFGFGVYTLFFRRKWLTDIKFYTALLITTLFVLPVIAWNIHYDFATYRFHSQRVAINGHTINYGTFLKEATGQFFINNPVNVAIIAISLANWKTWFRKYPRAVLLLFTGIPLALSLLIVSLFRPVFPHWSGPAYVSLIPVAAIYLAEVKISDFPRWLKLSLGGYLLFLIAWPLVTQFYPGTWGSKVQQTYGNGDVSLDRYGWSKAGKEFGVMYMESVAKGNIPANTPVVCNRWWGAHIEYYFCRSNEITMIGLGEMDQVGNYLWSNQERKHLVNMNQAFCIIPSDEYYDPVKAYSPYYENIQLVKKIEIKRGGKKAHHYNVFHLSGWKNNIPTPPHPDRN